MKHYYLRQSNLLKSILICGLMLLCTHSIWAQSIQVSGVVRDAKKVTLPGVSVVVKGTTIGVNTDLDGQYSITVPSNTAVLEYTFIGFTTQEQVVGTRAVIDITLAENTTELDEVIVVGYGTQRKSDVTGAIAVVTAAKLLESPSFNALQGMKGKAAGVNIFSGTGNPMGVGDKGPRVVIRGMNSINTSTDPLYVVDGVQMNEIQFLNPNDIERMEVLKDASATAIFGARGANGVILVTTKRGTTGSEGTIISYAGWLSVGTLAKKVDVMNSEEFMEMVDIGFANLSKYPQGAKWLADKGITEYKFDRSDPMLFDANGKPLYDTDWQKEGTRTAISHSHQLNIQSQSKKSSVGAFLNYTDQQGIMLNNYSKRISTKFAYDTKAKDWVSVSANLLVNHMWGNGADDTGGGQVSRRTMLEMLPILPVKFPNGKWADPHFDGNGLSVLGLEGMTNPVHEMETVKRGRYRTKIFGNVGFTFHLMDGLDLRTQLGVDGNVRMNKDYTPNDTPNMGKQDNGRASIYNGQNYLWQQENFLSYNKVFQNIHRINGTLGLSWSKFTEMDSNTGSVKGFSTNFFGYDNLGAGTIPSAPSSSWRQWAMNSYFGRIGYTLKDKYLLTATFRADGSSRFGTNNKYGFFPSAGLGWILSNEDFMKSTPAINNLKLHTSWGRTGNSEIDPYSTLATLTTSTILLNDGRAPIAQMARMPNPNLRWETTNQFDVGINLGLFQNRVVLEMDYYYKTTSDLLLSRPLPYTTGFSSVMDNIGQVDNQGIDFLLTTQVVRGRDFTWENTINLNYNKNEIKKLGANNEDILTNPNFLSGQVILRVGESLGAFYAKERLGTYSTDEAAASGGTIIAGTAKRSAQRSIVGNGIPKVTGSFVNRLKYKNFDFLLDLQFVAGVDAIELFHHSIEDRAGITNGLSSVLHDAWTPNNQNTMVQQVRLAGIAGQDSQADSHWISNGSYLRANMIQFGYTVDSEVLTKWGLKDFRFNLGVQNAFVLHSKDFKGYDPEATSNGDRFGQNIFFFQYPSARTFTFGLNFSF